MQSVEDFKKQLILILHKEIGDLTIVKDRVNESPIHIHTITESIEADELLKIKQFGVFLISGNQESLKSDISNIYATFDCVIIEDLDIILQYVRNFKRQQQVKYVQTKLDMSLLSENAAFIKTNGGYVGEIMNVQDSDVLADFTLDESSYTPILDYIPKTDINEVLDVDSNTMWNKNFETSQI